MCFQCNGAPRDRPAFPTRRSSDLSVAAGTRDQLMAYADNLREKLGQTEAVALLASEIDGKAALICVVTDAAFKARKVKAGDLINRVSNHVDGKGGGRPTLAQAGGQNPA